MCVKKSAERWKKFDFIRKSRGSGRLLWFLIMEWASENQGKSEENQGKSRRNLGISIGQDGHHALDGRYRAHYTEVMGGGFRGIFLSTKKGIPPYRDCVIGAKCIGAVLMTWDLIVSGARSSPYTMHLLYTIKIGRIGGKPCQPRRAPTSSQGTPWNVRSWTPEWRPYSPLLFILPLSAPSRLKPL